MKFRNTKITLTEKTIILFLGIIFIILPGIIFFQSIDIEWLEKPTNVGNNIAGILAPILSFGGSILVYIAFKGQIQANHIIQEQFIKQNSDQIYFRLIDTLERKVLSFSIIDINDVTQSGYSFITYSILQTNKKMQFSLSELGYEAFITKPELFEKSDFQKIYNQTSLQISGDDFMKNFIALKTKQERDNFLRDNRLTINYYTGVDTFYRELAIKYFYKFSTVAQMNYYKKCFQIYSQHPTFFHSYITNFTAIIKHINKSSDKEFYVSFLIENITVFEKLIIFLYVASNYSKDYFREFIKKHNVIDEIVDYPTLKIGKPENFDEHINSILSYNKTK